MRSLSELKRTNYNQQHIHNQVKLLINEAESLIMQAIEEKEKNVEIVIDPDEYFVPNPDEYVKILLYNFIEAIKQHYKYKVKKNGKKFIIIFDLEDHTDEELNLYINNLIK